MIKVRKFCLEQLEERAMMAVAAGAELPVSDTAVSADFSAEPQVTLPEPTGLKTWKVTSNASSLSSGTLRYAITYASSGDTIIFDQSLNGAVISFSSVQLTISKTLSIDASALADGITLNMNYLGRAFSVTSTAALILNNITIRRGSVSENGGAISAVSGSELQLYNCTFENCKASGNGGAVYTDGYFYAESCKFLNNKASGNGGAVYLNRTGAEFFNCLIADNQAAYGGGIYTSTGGLDAYHTTIANNYAKAGGGLCDASSNSSPTSAFYNSIFALNRADKSVNRDVYTLGTHDDSVELTCICTISDSPFWTVVWHQFKYDGSRPLFTDPENGDYTLAVNSQALDLGSIDYTYTDTDLAGNERITGELPDLGAYETPDLEEKIELEVPSITTGSDGIYASYGLNRHQITWNAVPQAAAYELAYSEDGGRNWSFVTYKMNETSVVLTGLTYGSQISYKIRAIGDQLCYSDSDWSSIKQFYVSPSDIDGDGFIGPGDLSILSCAWFTGPNDDDWISAADIDGNGFIAPGDRSFLSANWFKTSGDSDMYYPASAADIAFAEMETFESAWE